MNKRISGLSNKKHFYKQSTKVHLTVCVSQHVLIASLGVRLIQNLNVMNKSVFTRIVIIIKVGSWIVNTLLQS